MRRLLCITFGLLMVGCDPLPVKGEGVLHPAEGPPALYRAQHACTPGQIAGDPDCTKARLADCLGSCRYDFKYNGDMLYLRHCERQCEAEREGAR